MSSCPNFLDVPEAPAQRADVVLLSLPYEGTVSYGRGTAAAPEAVWRASAQIELWDEELEFALDGLKFHSAPPVIPAVNETAEEYLERVVEQGQLYQAMSGLVVGVGGEHSVTPALVRAAVDDSEDLSDITVVQFDAHADLRDAYDDSPHNHACAMRRLVDRGARLVAIGIRSFEREEYLFAKRSNLVQTFTARRLITEPDEERLLLDTLGSLAGRVYLTFDIDALEVSLCSGTGTPQPGGLSWWQTLRYLRRLLRDNRRIQLIGCDVVETVPQENSHVNETVAAALLAKMFTYRFAPFKE